MLWIDTLLTININVPRGTARASNIELSVAQYKKNNLIQSTPFRYANDL